MIEISFNPKTHRYRVNGTLTPSVTTILSVISKPALIQWLIKNPEAYIREQQEKAVTIGDQVHEAIMNILKTGKTSIETEYPEQVKNGIDAFLQWKKSVDFRVIETECLVASAIYGYAGRFDALGYVNETVTLCEWKTSKAIYSDHELQVTAYLQALSETKGGSVSQLLIGRFDKETGLPEIKIIKPEQDTLGAFLAAKKLYDWLKINDKKYKPKKEEHTDGV